MQKGGTYMHDMILIYLDFDGDDVEERLRAETDIRYMDKLIEKQGWKYSGIANYYVPIERVTREETVDNVYEVITSDERLKKYSPRIINSTEIRVCSLGEIALHSMVNPKDAKYNRYEKYYLENKELAHDIIVDEDKRIRDGYISYLLAEKYECEVNVIEVPGESPIAKIVIGQHVEYDAEQKSYVIKTNRRYAWIYTLSEAVVPGDILLVRTRKGDSYMQVEKITNIAGKKETHKYKKVKSNITAAEENEKG